MMQKIKRWTALGLILCALGGAMAQAEGVNIQTMRSSVPDTLTLTRASDDTVVADNVPVHMPEGDTLPIDIVRFTRFDTEGITQAFPVWIKRIKVPEWDHLAPIIEQTPEGGSRMGTAIADKYLPKDRMAGREATLNGVAANNDLDPAQLQALAQKLMTAGGVTADVRLDALFAYGPAYLYKEVEGYRPYLDQIPEKLLELDFDAPVKGFEQGSYSAGLVQYLHGARVMSSYYDLSSEAFTSNDIGKYMVGSWLHNSVSMRNEEDYHLMLSVLETVEQREADATLVPFDQILSSIQARVDSGDLKRVFDIGLVYVLQENETQMQSKNGFYLTSNDERVFRLRPTWVIRGYDSKYDPLMERHGADWADLDWTRYVGPYGFELRLDAITGEWVDEMSEARYSD